MTSFFKSTTGTYSTRILTPSSARGIDSRYFELVSKKTQASVIAPFRENFALGLVEVVLEARFRQGLAAPFELGCNLPPERGRVFDALLVHGVVIVHGIQGMRPLLHPRRRHLVRRRHLATTIE